MDNPIVKYLMEKYMAPLNESGSPNNHRDDIEKILNYRLSNYETGVSVSSVEKIGETPTDVSFRVEYEVDVKVPVGYDQETGRQDFEYDKEYRKDILVLKKEELSENLTPEEDADLAYTLTTLKTEAREAISKYELEEFGECKAILQYLVRDAKRALDMISKM